MKKTTHEGRSHHAIRPRTSLILLIAAWATCGISYAQSLIGSSGAGWQTWTAAIDQNGNGLNLNDNGAPYWDVPWEASGNYVVVPRKKTWDSAWGRPATARESAVRCSCLGLSHFGDDL